MNSRQIEDCAAQWLARRESGSWSSADAAALEAWLDQSTAHRVAFLRLESAWHRSDRLKALAAGRPVNCDVTRSAWRIPAMPRWRTQATDGDAPAKRGFGTRNWPAVAAVLVVGVGSALASYLWTLREPAYRTEVGGLSSVSMPDGSRVTLNTDSEIRVVMDDLVRRVELKHGEAFFEVKKDPRRPFVVHAGERHIVAIGTKFSVRRARDDVSVIVAEGRVRVEGADAVEPAVAATELAAGAVARSNREGTLVQARPLAEVEEYLSWRSGYLVFRDRTLGEAVDEFNRYNNRKIVISDPAVASIRIGGNFRTTNVDAFVRLLVEGLPVRATDEEDRIVLSSPG